ncbi:MAG: hypothetical protein IAE66_08395 [Xanthomonadaceae bacterium]|nr:hypothetical protein [Xanthomonadaceae bacterium]
MKPVRILVPALLAGALLTACNNAPNPPAPPSPPDAPQTMIGKAASKAIGQAREELATSNLTLGRDGGISINGGRIGEGNQPKAEITPQGDFLIEGKTVDVNAEQRALLLDYRRQVHGIAESGMAMGVKGADLAGTAIKEAIGGIFTGDGQQIEARIEAEAKKLEGEAKLLCAQLDPLLATQAKLATALPEFQPYATLTREDVDNCERQDGAAVISGDGQQVQSQIQDGIRRSVQTAMQGATAASGASGTATVDGVHFLLPVGRIAVNSGGSASTLDVGDELKVKLEGSRMWVNGTRYARPAKGTEVDLRTPGKVTVDGQPSYP